MNAERPEWVKCIARGSLKGRSWCGELLVGWHFTDVTHAAENGLQGGRLVACPECVARVVEALKAGSE